MNSVSAKYERLLRVKADCYDVQRIFKRETTALFKREFWGMEELFVICKHDDQGDVECILEISAINNSSARDIQVHRVTYFVNSNGIECPTCMLSLLGPLPVYKKNGTPFSYLSSIRFRSR